MAMKKNPAEVAYDVFNVATMILLMIVTLYPFYYVLLASVSKPAELAVAEGFFMRPQGFSLAAYKYVLATPAIRTGYVNTLIYMVAGTVVNLALTSLGAYGLSRSNLPGKRAMMMLITFTMFFSGGLIPTYLLVKSLGMLNSRAAMIIPVAINTWNLIIMRTAFQEVPASLEESARMDGANDLTILLRIFIPVSMPVVAVMILFYSVQHWNAFFNAMIYLRSRTLYPLQLILREIIIMSSTDTMMVGTVEDRETIGQTIKFATIIVTTLPILLAYPFLQRFFVKGVMIGAVKG